MNGKVVLAIAMVIIAAHALVLYMFFGGARHDAGQAIPAKPATQAAGGGTEPSPSRTQASASGAAQKPLHENPNLGKPFIYDGAVTGDIPGLPSCKDADAGLLVDLGSRKVLWAKDPRTPHPIASMTKMMTMLLAYEDVLDGRKGITLDSPVQVSRAAMKIGGSQVWLDPKETFPLRELLKAVAIQSANDAAYQVAEYLSGGDVHAFVARMNQRAKELGMPAATFHNPHGLPGDTAAEDNKSSAEGMAILAEHILEHPQLMEWASTWTAPFREPGQKGHVQLRNHNKLVPGSASHCTGVDGLKTGFINRSGFCVTITCKRGGRRLVAVVMDFHSAKTRDSFIKKLLDWGYERAAKDSSVTSAKPSNVPRKPSH